jgi:hypothetical protein
MDAKEVAEQLRLHGRYACPIPETPEYGTSGRDDPEGYYRVRQKLRMRLRANAKRYGFRVSIKTLDSEMIVTVVTE